ncbi:hypothetical protein [Pseudoduganella sp. OTU4001]|uniref:hypothetical protein n=1 Tax=Pseudoduganella sp. OTU4001 TaxID=3043854 RepID=UPI00313CDDA1
MQNLSPLKSFSIAVLAATVWFAVVMVVLNGSEPSPAAHAFILAGPFILCGALQFSLTRNAQLSRGRRAVQIGVSALLAPILATTIVWLVWVVALGRH